MKVKAKKRRLEVGDELGIDWERWADGRPWRLKRKRDFGDVDPAVAMEAAANAAQRMGKAVQTIRDRQFPAKYVWVQFADAKVRTGEPCPCGGLRLYRLHRHFLRCAQCGSMLLVSDSAVEDEYEPRPAARLRKMSGVHLARFERSGETDVYRGYAEVEGTPMVVIAEFRVEEGEELTADLAYERVERVDRLPFDRFSDLFDVDALKGDASEWDLVL